MQLAMVANEQEQHELCLRLVGLVKGTTLILLAVMLKLHHYTGRGNTDISPPVSEGDKLLRVVSLAVRQARQCLPVNVTQDMMAQIPSSTSDEAMMDALLNVRDTTDLSDEKTRLLFRMLLKTASLLQDVYTMEKEIAHMHSIGDSNVRSWHAPCATLYSTDACFSRSSKVYDQHVLRNPMAAEHMHGVMSHEPALSVSAFAD